MKAGIHFVGEEEGKKLFWSNVGFPHHFEVRQDVFLKKIQFIFLTEKNNFCGCIR